MKESLKELLAFVLLSIGVAWIASPFLYVLRVYVYPDLPLWAFLAAVVVLIVVAGLTSCRAAAKKGER